MNFILNGTACSGKDLFVQIVSDYLSEQTPPIQVKNISSVDNIKKAAELLGWDGVKNEKGRKFLSDLKDISTALYDAPMKYMESYLTPHWNKCVKFFHIREPFEITKFVTKYPATKTILIKRKNVVEYDNHADAKVEDYDYDYIIYNYGTLEEYKEIVEKFCEERICLK